MSSYLLKAFIVCVVFPFSYLFVPATLEHEHVQVAPVYDSFQQLFRHGYTAFQQKNHTEAVGFWRRFIAEDPGHTLLDYAYLYLGRSLLQSGHPQDARTIFEKFLQDFPSSIFAKDIPFLIAESYYTEGDYSGALHRYQAISISKQYKNHPWLPDASLKIGICYERQEQFSDAWKTYHQTRMKFVTNPIYTEIKKREDDVLAAHPETQQGYTPQTKLKDVATLLKYGRPRDALEILQPLAEQKLSDTIRANLLMKFGQAYYALRENETALTYFEAFLKKYPKHKSVTYAWDRIGRLHLRRQDLAAFQKVYAHLKKTYPKSRYTAGAIRLKGKELEQLGAYEDALKEFNLFLKWYPKSSLIPDILWHLGWTYYQLQRYEDALKIFKRLVRAYPKSSYREEVLYWTGKTAEQLKSIEDAATYYAKVIGRTRHSYYGIRSQQALDRLGQQHPDLTVPTPSSTLPSLPLEQIPKFTTARGKQHYQKAQELLYLQLYDLAANELAHAIEQDKADQTKYLELARYYNLAGQYRQQVRIMQGEFWKWIVLGNDELPDEFWRLAYPLSFSSAVTQATTASSLDPLLVFALMFAESVFDPEAYSSAGARGLMQLMPTTGANMAAIAGMPTPEPLQYFEPQINITLGTTYLKQLLDMFRQQLPPVIASYNAGEAVVSTWWKPGHQHADASSNEASLNNEASLFNEVEFIASIPYQQTKNYVQKVLWYYHEYQRIYRKN